jgi:hypothetical protein
MTMSPRQHEELISRVRYEISRVQVECRHKGVGYDYVFALYNRPWRVGLSVVGLCTPANTLGATRRLISALADVELRAWGRHPAFVTEPEELRHVGWDLPMLCITVEPVGIPDHASTLWADALDIPMVFTVEAGSGRPRGWPL